jgi:uncharacterized protein (TIGR02594 family)
MSIRRVITDVPAADVPFVAAMVAADGGVVVEQVDEGDGEFTLIAEFPSPVAAVAATAPATPGAGAASPVAGPAAAPAADAWMAVAREELGRQVAELPGTASNPRIEDYHATTGGGAAPDSVAWCSSFVNFCVAQAGGQGTRSKAARSWMTWGRDAGAFEPGCIVVLSRGAAPKGHVGFFAGFDGDRIQLLGGNQGDRISIASFDRSRVIARRLAA